MRSFDGLIGSASADAMERARWPDDVHSDNSNSWPDIEFMDSHDGIVGPLSTDPVERSMWGGGGDMFSNDDTFSNSSIDDTFSSGCGSSWDD